MVQIPDLTAGELGWSPPSDEFDVHSSFCDGHHTRSPYTLRVGAFGRAATGSGKMVVTLTRRSVLRP